MGDLKMIEKMMKEGMKDDLNGYKMGIKDENIERKWKLRRREKEELEIEQKKKEEEEKKEGRLDEEIVNLKVKERKGDVVVQEDEYISKGKKMEVMEKMKKDFEKEGKVKEGNE